MIQMQNIDLKEASIQIQLEGLELATNLIIKICGGEASKFSI